MIGFIPFPRTLVLWKMQSVSSRIWTRITVSISYDDDHYTTGRYIYIYIYTYVCVCIYIYIYSCINKSLKTFFYESKMCSILASRVGQNLKWINVYLSLCNYLITARFRVRVDKKLLGMSLFMDDTIYVYHTW